MEKSQWRVNKSVLILKESISDIHVYLFVVLSMDGSLKARHGFHSFCTGSPPCILPLEKSQWRVDTSVLLLKGGIAIETFQYQYTGRTLKTKKGKGHVLPFGIRPLSIFSRGALYQWRNPNGEWTSQYCHWKRALLLKLYNTNMQHTHNHDQEFLV